MVCTRHLLKQRSKVFVRCRRACNKITYCLCCSWDYVIECWIANLHTKIFMVKMQWSFISACPIFFSSRLTKHCWPTNHGQPTMTNHSRCTVCCNCKNTFFMNKFRSWTSLDRWLDHFQPSWVMISQIQKLATNAINCHKYRVTKF